MFLKTNRQITKLNQVSIYLTQLKKYTQMNLNKLVLCSSFFLSMFYDVIDFKRKEKKIKLLNIFEMYSIWKFINAAVVCRLLH